MGDSATSALVEKDLVAGTQVRLRYPSGAVVQPLPALGQRHIMPERLHGLLGHACATLVTPGAGGVLVPIALVPAGLTNHVPAAETLEARGLDGARPRGGHHLMVLGRSGFAAGPGHGAGEGPAPRPARRGVP